MKWIVISIANFLCLLSIKGYAANTCHSQIQGLEVCSPNNQWVAIESNALKKNAGPAGGVWLHRDRVGKELHSFIATPDRNEFNGTWDAYIHYAVEQFREKEFLVAEKTKLENQVELIKLSTLDKKTFFYQGYGQTKDKTIWSFNCMGPNQNIINTDCLNFMKSIRL
jgi:hypothetical protein